VADEVAAAVEATLEVEATLAQVVAEEAVAAAGDGGSRAPIPSEM